MTGRGAAAAVIVFDITSKDSFAKAKSWIKELQRQVSCWCLTIGCGMIDP